MKLTHSAPSRPMGRGKIERVFGVIQQQFLVEISGDPDGGSPARHPAASLEELNGMLAAWLRTVYHARPHSETGQAPAARPAAGAAPQVIGRHAHPKAPPDEDDPAPAEPTGIDYLQLVADADAAALAGELRLSALDDSEPDGEAGDSGQDGEGPR